MAIPISIAFENNYPGLDLASVAGAHDESTPPTINSQFLIDANQDLTVSVSWDTGASNAGVLATLGAVAAWEGEAILHPVSAGVPTPTPVSNSPLNFVGGAQSLSFTFSGLDKGIYQLFLRVSLRLPQAGAPASAFLAVNMVGTSDVIYVFDAV
jgi:hypothetical protein